MSTVAAKKERAVASLAYGIVECAQNTNATLLRTGGLGTVTDVPYTHGKASIVKNNALSLKKAEGKRPKTKHVDTLLALPTCRATRKGAQTTAAKKAKKACGFAPAFTAKTSPPRGNP